MKIFSVPSVLSAAPLDLEQPVLFDVPSQKQIAIDPKLVPDPRQ